MKIEADLTLERKGSLIVPPGCGPRHGVFYLPEGDKASKKGKTYFYIVTELTNHLHGYEVSYNEGEKMGFKSFYKSSIFGDKEPPNNVTYAAEVAITVSYIYPDFCIHTIHPRVIF